MTPRGPHSPTLDHLVRSYGRAEMSRADAKRALAALDEMVLDESGDAQKVRIGGLVQVTVRVRPAQGKRKGRNRATGEEIDVAAKPANVDVRARAMAQPTLPSLQRARRRLAASNGRASQWHQAEAE